jgi:ABC-type multidrug transport system fused ATPase/permease subunit
VIDADRILVLEQGHIVQEGAYESLAHVAGPFRDLIEARSA